MIAKADIQRVRNLLAENEGKRIRLSAKRGRNREVIRHGVIKETYASIFLVSLDSVSDFATTERIISFSYSDILIKSIEITVLDSKLVIA